MGIVEYSKIKVVKGQHKGKTGVVKTFLGKQDVFVEFDNNAGYATIPVANLRENKK